MAYNKSQSQNNSQSPAQQAPYIAPQQLRGYIKYLAVKEIDRLLEANFQLHKKRYIEGVKNLMKLIKYYINNDERVSIADHYKKYLKDKEKIQKNKSLNINEKNNMLLNYDYDFHTYLFGILLDTIHSPRFLPETVYNADFKIDSEEDLKRLSEFINKGKKLFKKEKKPKKDENAPKNREELLNDFDPSTIDLTSDEGEE